MRKRLARTGRGFTLLEMMLVVVIMGILATVVVVSFGGRTEAARQQATRDKMRQIIQALAQYEAKYAVYPDSLDALTAKTDKYIDKLPKDGWNRDFIYAFPSPAQNPDQPFDLISKGKDGMSGTPDDLNAWTLDRP